MASNIMDARQVLPDGNSVIVSVPTTEAAPLPIVFRDLSFDTEFPLSYMPNSASGFPDITKYDSPYTWSPTKKAITVGIGYSVTLLTAYSAGAYSAGSTQLSAYLHQTPTIISIGVTMYSIGFAIAPMLFAPLSEMRGRYPVFVANGLVFLAAQLWCALAHSFPELLVARFIVGVGASNGAALVGGLITDVYHAEERVVPMALLAAAALFGTGLGPLCSGFIAQHLSWRWIFFAQLVGDGLLTLIIIFFLQETRACVILEEKAKLLNRWSETQEKSGTTGFKTSMEGIKPTVRIRWKVKTMEPMQMVWKLIGFSIYTSFRKSGSPSIFRFVAH